MPNTRIAVAADAPLIAAHRSAMFSAMGRGTATTLDEMSLHFEPWVSRMIGDDKYAGWIVEDNGVPVASAGLLILDWPPNPLDPAGERRGYLLNVFVGPEYRRRGLARMLVERCLVEARRRGIRIVALHSSDAGRGIYESFGFQGTNEMLYVDPMGH